ncbi:MAG: chemotaxis response regulator protein-glutamate methylesterase [Steroidobacteraceae bacterium]|jgi:two-component system chemotaxis response regulator CheB
MKKIGVLIVDDSAVMRQTLSAQLARDPSITVLGAAPDPIFAMAKMKSQWPDVIVLDVEMPRMDGITFLRKIMEERPTPVVICSTLTEKGAVTTLEALAAGAVCIVTKPKLDLKRFIEDASADLINAVKMAAQANIGRLKSSLRAAPAQAKPRSESVPLAEPKITADAVAGPAAVGAMKQTTERIVAIGTSTGGTQALERVLTALPRACPGIAVVQHMPEQFTAAFAARLNGLCDVEVSEAKHGERLLPGHVLIAPGGKHLMLRRSGAYYYADVTDGPLVNRHKPSVDVLFRSVAKCAGANATGIIMTGMGDDGARGLLEMREAGAPTAAQDEASCVVFGMPKEAIRLGGAITVLPLARIAQLIVDWGR